MDGGFGTFEAQFKSTAFWCRHLTKLTITEYTHHLCYCHLVQGLCVLRLDKCLPVPGPGSCIHHRFNTFLLSFLLFNLFQNPFFLLVSPIFSKPTQHVFTCISFKTTSSPLLSFIFNRLSISFSPSLLTCVDLRLSRRRDCSPDACHC